MRKLLILLVTLALAACKQVPDVPTMVSPYRIDIQQGNLVTQEMVAKLKPGMTRAQVRFALGSPLVVDPFRTDRWDYVYMHQKQGKTTERRVITVIFEEDKLVRVEGDVTSLQPAVKPPVAASPATKPDTKSPAPKPAAAKPEPKAVPSEAPVTDAANPPTGAAPGEKPATDAAKPGTQAAKPDARKDKPREERGFFGRMLEKIGL